MSDTASQARRQSAPETGVLARLDALAARRADASFALEHVPAPAGPAEALLSLTPDAPASYWAEPDGSEHVGLGAAATLSGDGPRRFRAIAEGAKALFAAFGDQPDLPRLYGGFAFQEGRAASALWQPFGEARFLLPSLAYERRGDDARLVLVLGRADLADPERRARLAELAERALAALAVPVRSAPVATAEARLHERPDVEFRALVHAVSSAIERGELEKLVLARRVELELSSAPDPAQVLRRLSAIAPECLRFAFRAGRGVFLGATPERLVSKHGASFEAEAVAGSISMGSIPPGRLMESVKDRAEHEIVVRELVRQLAPLVFDLEHARVPEIHRLRHVAHLRTRVRGTLSAPHHVLDLVERLHPTPAVGGAPTARAVSWIAEHEPDERGWYAGPIGWFDATGDGRFAVALRSGLFSGTSAALYAGAGIVRGSDADSELAETRWKLAALLGALGVEP